MSRLGLCCALLFVLVVSTLAPASPTAAQETGTLTLSLGTRRVIGTASSATVKPTQPEGCTSSWAGLSYSPVFLPDFLLDGAAADGGDGATVLTWSGVAAGAHTITIPSMRNTYAFTSNVGDAETLWGVLYDAYIPTPSPVSGVTPPATVDTTSALSVASRSNPGVTVMGLPVAGVGPGLAQIGRLLAVMITVFLIAGGIVRRGDA